MRRGLGDGDYNVYLDGELIGEVRKRIQRYNLRRVVTVTSWIVSADGFPRRSDGSAMPHNTRAEAVTALVNHTSA